MISRRSVVFSAPMGLMAATLGASRAQAQKPDVIYVPTPPESVERMLRLAQVGPKDFLIDLGSGDGRIPIAAARLGARALGIEIDAGRVRLARANAQSAGVADRVTFRQENLFGTPLDEATVITLYLLPKLNEKLAPRLMALRPGTRIVSHVFAMGDWRPDATERAPSGTLYLWIVPARIEGRWEVMHGEERFTVELKQRYQELTGSAGLAAGTAPIQGGRLRGSTVTFSVATGGRQVEFRGTVAGNGIKGVAGSSEAGAQSARRGTWSAQRL